MTCSEEKACPDNFTCDNNICFDQAEPCSSTNHFGVCKEFFTCVEGSCKNLSPCSKENPTGICSSENRTCFQGICVEETEECKPWNVTGACPENYKCSEGNCVLKSQDYPCLPQFSEGKCDTSTEVCMQGICTSFEDSCYDQREGSSFFCPDGQSCDSGVCKTSESLPCSSEHMFGHCDSSDEVCYNGVCYNIEEPCSSENIYGKCNTGSFCNQHGVCEFLFLECDENKPCPNTERQVCQNNQCMDKPIFCEDGAINGLCPEGQSCVNQECKDTTTECSPSNLQGTCEKLNHMCVEGVCLDASQHGVCSESNPSGKCPTGISCSEGVCSGVQPSLGLGSSCLLDEECTTGLLCEKTFLDGYCTKTCDDNNDCNENSNCYKVNETTGYCLSKCSVNIPNSCSRANSEDYLCYPLDGNNGVCLYDCKYHGCFETGQTCNAITGICESK